LKIFHSHSDFSCKGKASAVSIGTFDGLHIGHKKILQQLIDNAKKNNLNAVVFTLFPHPRLVLQKDTSLKLLNTIDERIALLKDFGINCLVIEPFSKEFSRLTALEFVRDVLVNNLKTKILVVGYDHQFGRNREGNFEHLIDYSSLYNYTIEQIPQQDIANVAVSSTKIRKALLEGDIKTANAYLGYSYMLTGTVVKGKGLGKTLDFPTINLHISESYKLIPKPGVYIVYTIINNAKVFGIMNIGTRPTVKGTHQTIETFLLDYNGNLYDAKLQIHLLKRLRDEQKFSSLAQLKQQIRLDEIAAKKYIASIAKD